MAVVLDGDNLATTGVINSATAKTATGTAVDFTGIPAGTKRITVMFNGVSTNGTASVIMQVGSGSITSSGYAGGYSTISGTTVAGNNVTTGILVQSRADVANSSLGKIEICLLSGNAYVASGIIYNASYGGYVSIISSYISLSGALDRIRITTGNGTDTFDAGSINILYE